MIYIASPTHEEILNILQNKYKININPDPYLEGKYPHDPGRAMISQLRKYLEKLYVNVTILFNGNLPTDLQFSLKIIKFSTTNGSLNLIHNETTLEHLNHLFMKKKIGQTLQ